MIEIIFTNNDSTALFCLRISTYSAPKKIMNDHFNHLGSLLFGTEDAL